jgi:hypothetical protein
MRPKTFPWLRLAFEVYLGSLSLYLGIAHVMEWHGHRSLFTGVLLAFIPSLAAVLYSERKHSKFQRLFGLTPHTPLSKHMQ